MNEIIKCQKCGTEMIPIDDDKPIGMKCPECGWSWATTFIEPIEEDTTVYQVSLTEAVKSSETIKVISKTTNKNYIQAKDIISNLPQVIFSGKATDVKRIIQLLDEEDLKYDIDPSFPY